MYQNINKIYHAAIYVRLSKEDGDISSSAKLESNSISNQKALILDFLKDKKDIEVVSVRVDDATQALILSACIPGNAGRYPAWDCRLRSGKRFITIGREYIDSGKYIERLFRLLVCVLLPSMTIMTVSRERIRQTKSLSHLKNLINDAYCRDISIKIRSNLEIKRKKRRVRDSVCSIWIQEDKDR